MLLGLLAVAMFAGCQKSDELSHKQSDRNVTIELSVSTGEFVRTAPTEMENIINSLRIYAFYNGKKAGYLYREAMDSSTPLYIDLNLPERGIHNVEFYLIANEAEMADHNGVVILSENMTKAQLETVSFTGINKGLSLPMYEKVAVNVDVDAISDVVNTAVNHEGHVILSQKVEFKLKRPVAKLSFYGAKASGVATNPRVHKVELLAAGTRQYNYIFPQDDATLNAIPSRANNRSMLPEMVAITKSVTKGDAAALNPDNYTSVFANEYISEVATGSASWNTPSSSSNAGVLHVEYALDQGAALKNAYVYLPAIERNHHIKVCVLFSAEGNLIVNYDVADWDDNAMLDYHFDYPTHSYLMELLPIVGVDTTKPSTAATMSESKPFIGFFQMSKPANDAWTPTRLGPNGSNCEIIVYDVESSDEVENFPIPASDKWYRIEVWPLGGKMSVGDEVNLAISYRASGLTESEFLLINGSSNNYYWPYSGSTAEDANYVIITMVN